MISVPCLLTGRADNDETRRAQADLLIQDTNPASRYIYSQLSTAVSSKVMLLQWLIVHGTL